MQGVYLGAYVGFFEERSGRWGNYVNVGHRIVLHNSIVNAIPMFYDLSLFSWNLGSSLEEDVLYSKRVFMGGYGEGEED
jgi:hypothetical protein